MTMREKSVWKIFSAGSIRPSLETMTRKRIGRLAARFALGAHLRIGQTEADIVVREGAVSDEDGVA